MAKMEEIINYLQNGGKGHHYRRQQECLGGL